MAVKRSDLDAVLPQRPQHRIDFLPEQHKVAGDRSFTAARRLKVDCDRRAHGRRNRHAAFRDVLRTRHAKLVDAAVRRAFDAQRLLDARGVQIERRGGCCGGLSERRFAQRERIVQDSREFDRISVSANVHIKHRHRGTQQVIVDRGNFEPIVDEALHHRTDLRIEEHQIAHHHHAVAARRKAKPRTERQGGLDRDAIYRHVEIRAWQAELVDAAWLVRPFFSNGLVDSGPVHLSSRQCTCGDEGRYSNEYSYESNHRCTFSIKVTKLAGSRLAASSGFRAGT